VRCNLQSSLRLRMAVVAVNRPEQSCDIRGLYDCSPVLYSWRDKSASEID
jgi:hypothetical protein